MPEDFENFKHSEDGKQLNNNNNPPPKQGKLLKPGERGFSLLLLFGSSFMVYNAILLYRKSPSASSFGAVPLFVSTLLWLLLAFILLTGFRKSPATDYSFKAVADYVLPKNVVLVILLSLGYWLLLWLGLNFYVAAMLYLYGVSCCLFKKHYLKILLWTGLCTAAIVVVFGLLFQVS